MVYRIVQWATGSMGTEALRHIIDHPDLELAGVYVYSADKAGRDAGELCDRPATGIRATSDIEEILTLDADCVIHSPMLEPTTDKSDRDVQRLLASGKNVISCRGHQWPRWRGPEFAATFESACKEGNATLYGTGIEPGFMFDRACVALTSLCMRVRRISIREMFDCRTRPAHTIWDVCGFGQIADKFTVDHPLALTLDQLYTEMFHLMAAQFQTDVVSVTRDLELAVADKPVKLESGTIDPEGAVGVMFIWRVELANGVSFYFESRWFVDPDIPGWPTHDRKQGWRLEVEGEPSVEAFIDLKESFEPTSPYPPYDPTHRAIASLMLNAIPEVVAAPPGVLLPPVFAPWRERMA